MADTRKSIDLNEISKGSEAEQMLAELEGGIARASDAASAQAWAERFIAEGVKPASWTQRFIAAGSKVQSRNEQDRGRWATRFVASGNKTAK